MIITNTFWEEKHTGLKTCEIKFEKDDDFQLYLDANIEKEYSYSVAKIPVGDLSLVHHLEDHGYRYLENQLNISFEVDQINEVSSKWQRNILGFSYYLVKENRQLDLLLNEVSSEMFENDRFSLDPFWAGNISSMRYVNWIKDLYEKNEADFYIMKKSELDVGFFSIKPLSENVSSCPIAGIFNKYKSNGYFFVLTSLWFKECELKGNKRVIAAISSNNKPIHSFLSKVFSFRIDETLIVMRKVHGNHK